MIQDDGRCYMKNGAARLYNDLPEQEAAEWESRMIAQSYAVRKTEITRTAFRYIPSTYLLCEGDKAVPPKYQEMFAGLTGSELLKCDAGHSPMLSHTDMLVKHIVNAAEQAVLETQ
jgi:pimeloyl-ACP methyl ester carboxylesterase